MVTGHPPQNRVTDFFKIYLYQIYSKNHVDQKSFGLRNWASRHRYQPTGYSFYIRIHLRKRRNPIEFCVPHFEFEVNRGHLDLEIGPSDRLQFWQ